MKPGEKLRAKKQDGTSVEAHATRIMYGFIYMTFILFGFLVIMALVYAPAKIAMDAGYSPLLGPGLVFAFFALVYGIGYINEKIGVSIHG